MIVGFVGTIGSGKNAAADILVKKYNYNKESFANSVKDAVSVIFSWDRNMLEGDTPESRVWRENADIWWSTELNREITPRLALQLMGTEAGRDVFHPDLWIKSLYRRIDPSKNYVISDVRFPNEIAAIRANGGKIFRVKRGDEPYWYETAYKQNTSTAEEQWVLEDNGELMEQKYPEVHNSEWAWVGQQIDATIENNDTLEKLEEAIEKYLT
jgi:hypothetical protein